MHFVIAAESAIVQSRIVSWIGRPNWKLSGLQTGLVPLKSARLEDKTLDAYTRETIPIRSASSVGEEGHFYVVSPHQPLARSQHGKRAGPRLKASILACF